MALPIGEGQTISPPFIVAFMTEAIDPQPGDKVLEIGTGSGYQAAVLSPLVREVYTIEIVAPLGHKAEKLLQRLHYDNVHVKVGDGYRGWAEHAPFDKIIVTCSPEQAPPELVAELKEGGRMVIPVGQRYQQTLYLLKKVAGKMVSEALLPTLFVPMTGAAEQRRQVKPDPLHPTLENGDFEQVEGDPPRPVGWHYQRQLKVISDGDAPSGKNYVLFSNDQPGRPSQALQGFAVDGRKVARSDDLAQGSRPEHPTGTDARGSAGARRHLLQRESRAARASRPRSLGGHVQLGNREEADRRAAARPRGHRAHRAVERRGRAFRRRHPVDGGQAVGAREKERTWPVSPRCFLVEWAAVSGTIAIVRREQSSWHRGRRAAESFPVPRSPVSPRPLRGDRRDRPLPRTRRRDDAAPLVAGVRRRRQRRFLRPGEEFFAHFRRLGRLQPNETVLDIGCGVGRMAIPLLGYMSPEGRYVGFDISPQAIRWCTDHIAAKNPSFTFHVADIFNKEYNPRGTCRAAEYRFPCEDGSVDFAFAASVFTHMLPDDVRRYLAEIHRVLKPGGRGLFTHFILNAESEAAMSRLGGNLRFLFPLPECRTIDPDVPERAIAFDEAILRRMYAEAGLSIEEPIRFARGPAAPVGCRSRTSCWRARGRLAADP